MSQRTIELHDSVIATIVLDGGTTLITFSHAYIHQSDGVPGVDPGSGWSQRAELRINRSSIPDVPENGPYEISDGQLELDGVAYRNELPIPLSHDGFIRLKLSVVDGDGRDSEIAVTGRDIELRLIGEAEYIEEFS